MTEAGYGFPHSGDRTEPPQPRTAREIATASPVVTITEHGVSCRPAYTQQELAAIVAAGRERARTTLNLERV